jgi:hypothetical protein
MLESKYWQPQAGVTDKTKMFMSILSLASLFIDQIVNFFYQNEQWKKLHKV